MHKESAYQEKANKIKRQSVPGREKEMSKARVREKRPSSPPEKDVVCGMPVILCK